MRRIIITITAAVIAVVTLGAPALAQDVPDLPTVPEPPVPMPHVPGTVPPPPDLPAAPVPTEAEPTVAVAAPLTNEGCRVASTATTNAAKVPQLVALGLALVHGPAIEAIPSLSPYLNLPSQPCTGLAGPDRLSECASDRQAAALLDTLLGLPGVSAAGAVFGLTGIRIDVPNAGAAFDVVAAAKSADPTGGLPPTTADESLYDQLGCEDILAASFGAPTLPDAPALPGLGGLPASAAGSPVPPAPASSTSSALRAVLPDPGSFAATTTGGAGAGAAEAAAPSEVAAGAIAGTDAARASSQGDGLWERALQALAAVLLVVAGVSIVQTERRPTSS